MFQPFHRIFQTLLARYRDSTEMGEGLLECSLHKALAAPCSSVSTRQGSLHEQLVAVAQAIVR